MKKTSLLPKYQAVCWIIGAVCLLVNIILWSPDTTTKQTVAHLFFCGALVAVMCAGIRADNKLRKLEKNGKQIVQKPLRFLVVCELPVPTNQTCVVDAVTDYLCALLCEENGGPGLSYDFIDVAGAGSKVAENLAGPENERYQLVFVDLSAPKAEELIPKIIWNLELVVDAPVVVPVGNVETMVVAAVRFMPKEWTDCRTIFQDRLKLTLRKLNLLPGELNGE